MAYRGALYVAGGHTSDGVYFAVPAANGALAGWQATTALPGLRARHALAAWDGRLYVVGGEDGQSDTVATVLYASVASNHTVGDWIETTPLPEPRQDLAAVAHDGHLLALGGRSGGDGNTQRDTVWAAPIRTDGSLGEWAELPPLPAARYNHAAFVRGDHVYVVGGRAGGTCFSDVLHARLGPGARPGPWTSAPALPAPRSHLGVAASHGFLYAVGGADGGGNRDWAAFVRFR